MAQYVAREWSKKELLSYVGDPHQLAGAQISTLNDGKAEGGPGGSTRPSRQHIQYCS